MDWILSIFNGLLYVAFAVSAILLIVVILLQEGKGGGMAEAFGGVGGETFGVRASSISKFTGYVAFVFMAAAILIPITQKAIESSQSPFQSSGQSAPEIPGGENGAAGAGGAGNETTPPPEPPKDEEQPEDDGE